MNKVLLVIDEYTELKNIESALKKVGFNVVGITSEFAISEQILIFNPDFIVSSGTSGKINSLSVGKRLKEMSRWSGKTILGFPAGFKPDPQDLIRLRMDSIFESPSTPNKVISILAKYTGQDVNALLEKLNAQVSIEESEKIKNRSSSSFDIKDENVFVSGGSQKDEPVAPFSSSGIRFKPEPTPSESENPFATPDFKLMEKELETLSGKKSTVDPVVVNEPKKSEEKSSQASLEEGKKWSESIAKANEKSHQRLEKAKESLKAVKLSKESQVTRKKTHKVQKELRLSWDEEELKKQDELRKEFTQKLFKKKI